MWNQQAGYSSYGQPGGGGGGFPPAQNGYYGGPVSNAYHNHVQQAAPAQPYHHHQQQQSQPLYPVAAPPPMAAPPHLQRGPYHPPAGPPVDPFRAYYAGRLRELTFNSRPIIQDLSLIAQNQRNENNWSNMGAIVDELEQAILASAPHEKLPKLYLLDSISKNVGAPYTTQLLPPVIPRLYQRTYREVDGVTKSKMEEMIGLWRTGGPNRSELYGAAVREAVELDIFGSTAFNRGPPAPTQERVIATMQAALAMHHKEVTARPWDTLAMQNFQVLQALNEMLMSRSLPPQELQQIMDKLTAMAPKPAPVASTPLPPTNMGQYSAPTVQGGMSPVASSLPPFPPSQPRDAYHHATPPVQSQPQPSSHSMQMYTSTPPHPSSTPTLGAPAVAAPPAATGPPSSSVAPAPVAGLGIPIDVANILKSLTGAGLGSAPRTPDNAPVALPRTKLDDYEDMILAMDVKLSEVDLNKKHSLPLDHLPERCTQCYMRFPEKGPKLEAHMDWHFRRNKQERQSEGRGAHRRWLPKAEDWINDVGNAEAGPSTAVAGAGAAGQATEKPRLSVEQLRKRWVPVPTDPLKKARPCGICKEPFKDEWEDKEEIWIWKNAIEVEGKFFHATCRAELLENRRLAKLKSEGEGRSASKSKSPGATPAPDVKTELSGPAAAVPNHSTASAINGSSGLSTSTAASQPALENESEEPAGSTNGAKRKAEENGVDPKPEDGDAKRVKVEAAEANVIVAPPAVETATIASNIPDIQPDERPESKEGVSSLPAGIEAPLATVDQADGPIERKPSQDDAETETTVMDTAA